LFSAVIKSPVTRDPYERKLVGFLKRMNMDTEAFTKLTKKIYGMWRGELYHFFQKIESESKRLGIISKSTL
jgi:hypothetical protein